MLQSKTSGKGSNPPSGGLKDAILTRLFFSPFEEYEIFKSQAAGILYDYYFPHKLDWPASCCRWVSEVKDDRRFPVGRCLALEE